ncbi:hypothetical protein [Chitinophaga sp. YIM B06452]|uniref:hypothetical protein n=1 Tax=Chitinophaga sp. YIM B06452 TaxID=3082158 RepID=UPI0031FEB04E
MKARRDIEQEINRTLGSLDGVQRAEPGDFFFTRLQARLARMREEPTDAWERFIGIISRPSVAFSALALILAVNGVMFALNLPTTGRQEQAALQQAFADEEYQFGIANFYELEKPEQ